MSVEQADALETTNPDPQLRMTKELLTLNGSATDLRAVQERESALLRDC